MAKKKSNDRRAPIIWFSSNPDTVSKRDEYVLELVKHIDIDIYGNSGVYKSKFPNNYRPDPCGSKFSEEASKSECYLNLFKSYKFYLSFENSLCHDFITEKLWKLYTAEYLFNVNIVPIVRGANEEDYSRVAFSDRSYINVDKYDSPKTLAAYLTSLVANQTAYLEHLSWKHDLYLMFLMYKGEKSRSQHVFHPFHTAPFCFMCAKLHDVEYMNGGQSNRVHQISEWFNPKKECWDPEKRPYSMPINIFGDNYFRF